MQLSDFDYELPEAAIAQTPVQPRDHSKLLVYDRASQAVSHRHFYDLPQFLRAGDVLVVNESRVLPARLLGTKLNPDGGPGAQVELLLLRRLEQDRWATLVRPGRRLRPGASISFGDGLLIAEIESDTPAGGRIVRFKYQGLFEELLDRLGQMPLPPYITERLADPERYQTVYAKAAGSAAAPTAGLHFTPELLAQLQAMGVRVVPVLLHVGLGTFRPVEAEVIEEHQMHAEYFELTPEAAAAINGRQGRLFAVGTTSVRVLEASAEPGGEVRAGSGWTDIFIYPGYAWRAVEGLITNFHLPKSSLLMLVSSFAGREETLALYQTALAEGYRFFSFGDAMLIL